MQVTEYQCAGRKMTKIPKKIANHEPNALHPDLKVGTEKNPDKKSETVKLVIVNEDQNQSWMMVVEMRMKVGRDRNRSLMIESRDGKMKRRPDPK